MFWKDSHYMENYEHDFHDMYYYFFYSQGFILVMEVKMGSDFTILIRFSMVANHRMVCIGRDLEDNLLLLPCHGQGHLL